MVYFPLAGETSSAFQTAILMGAGDVRLPRRSKDLPRSAGKTCQGQALAIRRQLAAAQATALVGHFCMDFNFAPNVKIGDLIGRCGLGSSEAMS